MFLQKAAIAFWLQMEIFLELGISSNSKLLTYFFALLKMRTVKAHLLCQTLFSCLAYPVLGW